MTPQEAEALILYEGVASGGMALQVRMGEDPGPERMAAIVDAIRTVHDSLDGVDMIGRSLAYALHCLATEVPTNINSWIRVGATWREALVAKEQFRLMRAVESVFSGHWSVNRGQ
jgi:hypothetical protein